MLGRMCSLRHRRYHDGQALRLYVPYLLGGWSPTIASYVILKKQGEVTGFKDWPKHIFDIKHSLSAYLITVLLAIVDFVPLMLISGFKQNMPLILLPIVRRFYVSIQLCIAFTKRKAVVCFHAGINRCQV